MSPTQARQRAAHKRIGVGVSEKKARVREPWTVLDGFSLCSDRKNAGGLVAGSVAWTCDIALDVDGAVWADLHGASNFAGRSWDSRIRYGRNSCGAALGLTLQRKRERGD